MAVAADKFAQLAALKPTRPVTARTERATLRTPGDEDVLGQLLGAGVAKNHFGEHLAIQNGFPTREFKDQSSATIDLFPQVRDEAFLAKTAPPSPIHRNGSS